MTFSCRVSLRKHVRKIHNREDRNHKCEKCDKIYAAKKDLKYHLETTHNKDRVKYNCKLCHKTLSSLYILKIHLLRVHSEKNDHICTICSKQFSLKSDVRKQIAEVHKKTDMKIPCAFCNKMNIH